ncbi:MAG: tail fiber domain-containing protein, partial [Thermoanaerobaculia bacterium]|nr:tail fiber domain-containing protein [Thermoanaerobaculia bacterium]
EGFRNTATGFRALASNTTGHRNTADGHLALFSNSTGYRNTALGNRALYANEGGNFNTAVGDRAMQLGTSGDWNTAVGSFALHDNTEGLHNTAVGAQALFGSTSGVFNTAVGAYAMHEQAAGNRNTAIGFAAGYFWEYGSNNIAIGIGAYGASSDDGVILIGGDCGLDPCQTQTFVAGISGTAVSGVQVLVTPSHQLGVAASSARFKEQIRDLDGVSGRLLELRPVAFRYKDELVESPGEGSNPLEYGLVAEEVAAIFPELVANDRNGEPYTVRYHLLAPLLLGEVQRQQAELDRRGDEVAELRARLAELERLVDGVERSARLRVD